MEDNRIGLDEWIIRIMQGIELGPETYINPRLNEMEPADPMMSNVARLIY